MVSDIILKCSLKHEKDTLLFFTSKRTFFNTYKEVSLFILVIHIILIGLTWYYCYDRAGGLFIAQASTFIKTISMLKVDACATRHFQLNLILILNLITDFR